MSKLLGLKEWITPDEAAEHLTRVLDEGVSVADIYRFALAGHLTISANFANHARGHLGKRMSIRDAGFSMMPGLQVEGDDEQKTICSFSEGVLPHFQAWLAEDESRVKWMASPEPKSKFISLNGQQISDDECLQFDRKSVATLEGLWDLPMIGAERLDIANALHLEVGLPEVELINLDGPVVSQPNGCYAVVLERFSKDELARDVHKDRPWNDPRAYFPAGGLPADAAIVVRPSELASFVTRLTKRPDAEQKELHPREKNNLLRIVAALCRIAKIDTQEGGKGAQQIEAAVAEAGFDGPKEKAVRRYLAELRGIC